MLDKVVCSRAISPQALSSVNELRESGRPMYGWKVPVEPQSRLHSAPKSAALSRNQADIQPTARGIA